MVLLDLVENGVGSPFSVQLLAICPMGLLTSALSGKWGGEKDRTAVHAVCPRWLLPGLLMLKRVVRLGLATCDLFW